MKFGLAQQRSDGIGDKSKLITALSDKLEEYFSNRSYGDSIELFVIGIICIKPEFEFFFKKLQKKYTKSKKELEYEIKLEFNQFKMVSNENVSSYVLQAIIDSLEIVNTFNIADFNTLKFKHDLKTFKDDLDNDK